MQLRIEINRISAGELLSMIQVYALMQSEKRLTHKECYHMHIMKDLYRKVDSKYMNMIYNEVPKSKIKLDKVQALAICELIDIVQATSMEIRDIRIELGKYVPNTVNA